jgi:hypothetical protein
MKITYFLATLLLMSSFATQATAHVRTNRSSNRAHVGTRPTVGSWLQGYRIEGREIVAPPWSFACMTDHGPSECGEHVWFYGSGDALERYMNGF